MFPVKVYKGAPHTAVLPGCQFGTLIRFWHILLPLLPFICSSGWLSSFQDGAQFLFEKEPEPHGVRHDQTDWRLESASCPLAPTVADDSGRRVAIVCEGTDRCHTQVFDDPLKTALIGNFAFIENVEETLPHYLNRRGDDSPNALTRADCPRLMAKDDGTAMGSELVKVPVNPIGVYQAYRSLPGGIEVPS